jgi:hypothetical protein
MRRLLGTWIAAAALASTGALAAQSGDAEVLAFGAPVRVDDAGALGLDGGF